MRWRSSTSTVRLCSHDRRSSPVTLDRQKQNIRGTTAVAAGVASWRRAVASDGRSVTSVTTTRRIFPGVGDTVTFTATVGGWWTSSRAVHPLRGGVAAGRQSFATSRDPFPGIAWTITVPDVARTLWAGDDLCSSQCDAPMRTWDDTCRHRVRGEQSYPGVTGFRNVKSINGRRLLPVPARERADLPYRGRKYSPGTAKDTPATSTRAESGARGGAVMTMPGPAGPGPCAGSGGQGHHGDEVSPTEQRGD